MKRLARVAKCCTAIAGAAMVLLLVQSLSARRPLSFRFLYYTNNVARARIAVMEVSNRTDAPYEWTFHSHSKQLNHVVGASDLMETNGELRPVGPFTGCNLFEHDALRFGTDDFHPGERFWVEVKHYPKTTGERWREELSYWLERRGLRRFAPYVRVGERVNGPVLPPDHP